MKTENIILIGLLVLVVGGLVWAVTDFLKGESGTSAIQTSSVNNKEAVNSQTEAGYQTVSTGTTGSGDVSIDLTPHKINNGQLEVDIAVNTHSVDLNQFDLKEITTLEFDDKSINPASAPILRGHHNSGTLVFEVSEDIDSFTIKIMGIPKVEERVFEWR